MGRALISHLSTNDINKSLVGNGGERDEAIAEPVVWKPRGYYVAEPHQKSGPGLEGCTSCKFYKQMPYGQKLRA